MTLRILHVINSLGAGGAEQSLAEMLPSLRGRGINATVACLYHRQEGVERSVLKGDVDVRFLPGAHMPARVAQLREIIRSKRPHVVHTTLFEANVIGRLAAVGTPSSLLTSLVSTPYEPVRLRDPNISAPLLRSVRIVDGWTSRHLTTHFHAITHAVKRAAVRDLAVPPDRITVIERGRDPERLGRPSAQRRRRSREALGLGEGDVVVVTVGRHEYQKGQAFLVEAVRILLDRYPRMVLLIAGRDGHATPELRRLGADRAVGAKIRLLGHRDDVPEILAAADVFAFPSLLEGLGGAVIEAMALGLPVVASDIPALREVVDHGSNAELIESGSVRALAAALDGLLSDRNRMFQFGIHSRRLFEQRFSLDRSIDRMVDLYNRVTESKAVEVGAAR